MIPVKEAVKEALRFVAETFQGEALQNPRVEEVESSDDNAFWYITVSFFRNNPNAAFAASMSGSVEGREYKTVSVDANTGTAKSVKIRQLT